MDSSTLVHRLKRARRPVESGVPQSPGRAVAVEELDELEAVLTVEAVAHHWQDTQPQPLKEATAV